MRDEFDLSEVGFRVLIFPHDDLPRPADDVGVGHDAFAPDDEARATGALHGIESPRRRPIGRLAESLDLDDRTFGFDGETRPRDQKREANRDDFQEHAGQSESLEEDGQGIIVRSLQTAIKQIIFVQAEIVAEFVKISGVDFFEEKLLVAFGEGPEIFQIQDDLRRHGRRAVVFLAKRRAGEQSERILGDAVGHNRRAWFRLEGDWQARCAFAQGCGQLGQCGVHFSESELCQLFPVR